MNYLLVFYTGNEIKRATLRKGENITAGSGDNDTVKIDNAGLEANHLTLRYIDGGIKIVSRTPFEVADNSMVNRIISAGDIVKINKYIISVIVAASFRCLN